MNVEVLRVFCDQMNCFWKFFKALHRAFGIGLDPHLRQIQLFFKLPCRSLAYYVASLDDPARNHMFGKFDVVDLLTNWESSKIMSFETYFLELGTSNQDTLDAGRYKQADLLREIRAVKEETGVAIDRST